MTDPASRERAALDVLNLLPDGWHVGRRIALILGRLSLAMTLVAGCGAIGPVENDPVPLPADLAAIIEAQMGPRMRPADGSVPRISATEAVAKAGVQLVGDLKTNSVAAQDPSVPDGLVRRQVVLGPGKPRTSVWMVVYRWKAGFDCHSGAGGPGSCAQTSFYFIDDRTGELISSYDDTRP